MEIEIKKMDQERAVQKVKNYCGYQQGSNDDVKQKLYGYGQFKTEGEELLCRRIEEHYLNEERYAIAFAGGKFRMKQWGKTKIKYELKLKKVNEYCIKKALNGIDKEDYFKTLKKLADEKSRTLKAEKNIFIKTKKLQNYLVGKGYEYDLIAAILKETDVQS